MSAARRWRVPRPAPPASISGPDRFSATRAPVPALDSPSGTAITLAKAVETAAGVTSVPVEAKREGDVMGLHSLTAASHADRLVLTHEAFSRRGFAEGAVRAAEWLSSRTGCYDFQSVYTEI